MHDRCCYNCFREKDHPEGPCPFCGYDPAMDEGKYPFALPHGSVLAGQYITGRVLGQGGFGVTYLALEQKLGYRVAVKEFLPESVAGRSAGSLQVTAYTGQRQDNFQYGMERFLEEARVLAKFQGNPNIVGVRGYFEENGTAYFVMDYIEGISFKNYIKNQGGRVSWKKAVEVLAPVMDALAAVHREGIIHRDVTPDNIYITSGGVVKLLDFGSARYSLGDRSKSLDVVLKEGYAPKEQYTRRGRQGPYTDVYSLAACFYSAITGYLPPEALDRMEEDDLVPPSARGIKLPPALEGVILRGLEVQPADRYQTMEEFRAALDAALAEDAPEPGPAPRPGPEPSPEDPAGKRKKPPAWVWGAGAACAAAVLALAILPRAFSGGQKGNAPSANTNGGQPAAYLMNEGMSGSAPSLPDSGEDARPDPSGGQEQSGEDVRAEEAAQAEAAKQAEEAAKAEEARKAEEAAKAEEARKAEEETRRKAEEEANKPKQVTNEPFTMVTSKFSVTGTYTGEWKDGKPNGTGTMTMKETNDRWDYGDTLWSANWVNGLIEGYGQWRSAVDGAYDGNFSKGLKSGYGKMWFSDGTVYDGQWSGGDFKG